MSIKITGLAVVMRKIAESPQEVNDASADVVAETAANYHSAVALRMKRGPHTGKVYGNHQASGPGQAPAPDTGTLIGSIYHEMLKPLTWVAGSRLKYAEWLEYGTVKMAARPAWEPEALKAEPVFRRDLEQAVKAALK